MRNLGRGLGLIGALWVAVGLAITIGWFWRQTGDADGLSLQIVLLGPALALASTSFGLRVLRWHLFVRAAGGRPSLLTSLRTQLIGFSLTMTPGKVGEVYKCYLMELETGIPTARLAPIVLFEKLTDGIAFAGLSVVAAAGLPDLGDTVPRAGRSLLVVAAIAVAMVVALRITRPERVAGLLVRALGKLPLGARFASLTATALTGGADVLRAPVLAGNLALTLAARTADGLAMASILVALGAGLPVLAAVLAFNFAGTLGGLSMLPGGIGVVEATMSLMLVGLGAPPGAALGAMLLSRLLSFWLWVAIGLALLLLSGLRAGQQAAS